MARYRKRPVVIDAVQWDGTARAATPIINWILDGGGTARYHEPVEEPARHAYEPPTIVIDTLEGPHHTRPDDWVIKGVQGEFYPCKPDIFEATYEPANE